MTSRKGFTLIELMIVILIVAILAAVLVPLLASRIEQAKWSEGKTGAGTVATALRAWCVENGVATSAAPSMGTLGFTAADLNGKYFESDCYTVTSLDYDPNGTMDYVITVDAAECKVGANGPSGSITLNQEGVISGP